MMSRRPQTFNRVAVEGLVCTQHEKKSAHLSSHSLDEIDTSDKCPSSGHQIINEKHSVPLVKAAARDRQAVVASIFLAVLLARDRVGHFALLAKHDERHFECEGNRWTQNEPSGINADDAVHVFLAVALHKYVYHQLEGLRILQETPDVVEPFDSFEREVRSHGGNAFCNGPVRRVIFDRILAARG